MALEALFEELRRDLEDEELAKIILETLDIVTAKSDGNSGGEFCEILLKVHECFIVILTFTISILRRTRRMWDCFWS